MAVTDTLQIAANGLPTVAACNLPAFLKDYCSREQVDKIVVGYPRTLRGDDSESMNYIRPFIGNFKKQFPDKPITMYDERFTSVLAHRAMIDGGMKKKDRQNKAVVDNIAACIILEGYLEKLRV